MRCNACWRELEGKAISTTCGHLLCTEDASKVLSNDAACPVCDQVLSKSHMRPVDINPGDEWINMALAGVSPQILMKSAYRGVMFYVGQKELEMQYKLSKIIGQCRQKCEAMQEKFTEKLEQVHTAYQKMAKRCQMMEQEIESLSKDKQELQEKYAEKSRQKRKLDQMYDQLRSEYESVKRSAVQPVGNFFSRTEPDLFSGVGNVVDSRDRLKQVSGMGNMMDSRDCLRQDRSVLTPKTPGQGEDIWPSARHRNRNSGASDLSGASPSKAAAGPVNAGTMRQTHSLFGPGASNPAATLRNLIISPMNRPQLSRSRPYMFTL